MELFDSLAAAGRRWNVLKHPFYRRWEAGELEPGELGYYAGQYRHAAAALAATARSATELAGPEHAAEEAAHVRLWDLFAAAAGGSATAEPSPETRTCVEAWTGASDPLEALAILNAIESAQPAISTTKLAGLVEHYGFEPGGAGTAYFELHAERDVAHASESRALLEEHATAADTPRLVAAAERALEGNWTLLDGVERQRELAPAGA